MSRCPYAVHLKLSHLDIYMSRVEKVATLPPDSKGISMRLRIAHLAAVGLAFTLAGCSAQAVGSSPDPSSVDSAARNDVGHNGRAAKPETRTKESRSMLRMVDPDPRPGSGNRPRACHLNGGLTLCLLTRTTVCKHLSLAEMKEFHERLVWNLDRQSHEWNLAPAGRPGVGR